MTASMSLDEFVLRAVAAACRVEPSSIDPRTSLLDVNMDSLTFVSILTQIEAAYDIELSASDTADLFGANDIGELVAGIQRTLRSTRAIFDESAENGECADRRS